MAKNYDITIEMPATAFGGTLVVLPAVALLIQTHTMLLYLNLSERIRKFLHPLEMPEPTEMGEKLTIPKGRNAFCLRL